MIKKFSTLCMVSTAASAFGLSKYGGGLSSKGKFSSFVSADLENHTVKMPKPNEHTYKEVGKLSKS
jgi:hypothetical protein